MPTIVTAPAPNTPFFTPGQFPASGTAVNPQPDGKPIPKLFQPLKIRGVEFHNRIWLSPLCQYSAEDGVVTPWHLAHLGGIISRGPGLSFVEATAVLSEGRISPNDVGIWADKHIEPLKKIVEFAHSQNQKIGIQIGHAGRKASTVAPWLSFSATATKETGGWPDEVVGPSDIPFNDSFPKVKALTKEGIQRVVEGFVEGARRALKAGFDVIEIHGAHGYLLSEFYSPTVNNRTDEYGGSFENRIRLLVEVVDAVRAVVPPTVPLFVRLSATEWLEESQPEVESWRIEETVKLAGILAEHDVDLIDVSSGGINAAQKIKAAAGAYQAPFAEAVKKAHGDKILVSSVGGITNGHIAQEVLDKGQADAIMVGRYFQKNPGLVWAFAEDLGVNITVAHQIEWPFIGRGGLGRSKVHPKKEELKN